MIPKKRFIMFSILVFGMVTGLIFFGTRSAKVQTGVGCRFERRAVKDNQPEKIELIRLIESVGKKSNCSNLIKSN